MPRSSSPSRSCSYSSPRSPIRLPTIRTPSFYKPSIYKAVAPTPAPVAAPAPITHERPGFFSNMWQGFGLGAGQAIAHNIFRSNPTVTHVHAPEPVPAQEPASAPVPTPLNEYEECMKQKFNDRTLCIEFSKEFKECMKQTNDDISICKQLANK